MNSAEVWEHSGGQLTLVERGDDGAIVAAWDVTYAAEDGTGFADMATVMTGDAASWDVTLLDGEQVAADLAPEDGRAGVRPVMVARFVRADHEACLKVYTKHMGNAAREYFGAGVEALADLQ